MLHALRGDIRQLRGELHMDKEQIMSQISDLADAIGVVSDEVGTIGTGVATVEAELAAIKGSNTSTLSADDQAALDRASAGVASMKIALDNINATLPAAQAAAAQPAPTDGSNPPTA